MDAKGGAVFRYNVSIEVERVDVIGQIEQGALEGAPVPVLSLAVDGTVRAPDSKGAPERAARRAMHDASNKIARRLDEVRV